MKKKEAGHKMWFDNEDKSRKTIRAPSVIAGSKPCLKATQRQRWFQILAHHSAIYAFKLEMWWQCESDLVVLWSCLLELKSWGFLGLLCCSLLLLLCLVFRCSGREVLSSSFIAFILLWSSGVCCLMVLWSCSLGICLVVLSPDY